MIKAKKSISPNNTVFFSQKNEDDFETIIEDCYSSSGDNLLSDFYVISSTCFGDKET